MPMRRRTPEIDHQPRRAIGRDRDVRGHRLLTLAAGLGCPADGAAVSVTSRPGQARPVVSAGAVAAPAPIGSGASSGAPAALASAPYISDLGSRRRARTRGTPEERGGWDGRDDEPGQAEGGQTEGEWPGDRVSSCPECREDAPPASSASGVRLGETEVSRSRRSGKRGRGDGKGRQVGPERGALGARGELIASPGRLAAIQRPVRSAAMSTRSCVAWSVAGVVISTPRRPATASGSPARPSTGRRRPG